MKKLMVVLACGLLAVSGCGPGEKVAKTPKEAVVHLAEAMEDGDADAFAACFDATPEQKPMLRSMGDFTATLFDFQKEMVATYGDESGGGMKGGGPAQGLQAFDKSQLDK